MIIAIATRAQAIALLKKGFDKALQMVAGQYVMPICWIAAEKGRPLILGNGSAFMLCCEAQLQELILPTPAHSATP